MNLYSQISSFYHRQTRDLAQLATTHHFNRQLTSLLGISYQVSRVKNSDARPTEYDNWRLLTRDDHPPAATARQLTSLLGISHRVNRVKGRDVRSLSKPEVYLRVSLSPPSSGWVESFATLDSWSDGRPFPFCYLDIFFTSDSRVQICQRDIAQL